MKKIEKLVTHINTVFYDYKSSRNILLTNTNKEELNLEEKTIQINKECEKIVKKELSFGTLNSENRYFHIAFDNYSSFKRNEKDELIYKIEKINDDYYISTGLYCGVINLGEKLPQIQIETGLSDIFFKRMLSFCCGVYADTFSSETSSEDESIYSLLIQYLFLISLRKVAGKSIPKKYVMVKERGYDIKGNIDVESFVNNDILAFDKKITYNYSKRLEIQSIIDVLYTALRHCKISQQKNILPTIHEFQRYINDLYSGKRPTNYVINNILKEKCLFNSLYSDFKRPLEYAKILIKNNDLSSDGKEKTKGVSGFLVDASFLWEMYLYNLMTLYLKDWYIESQCEISFYNATFFSKNNYPDFVLRHKKTNKVFILDAKFKKMNFISTDVDNEDIRQLHSYSYYFHLKEEENFMGAGLIYPTKKDRPKDINNIDNIYGIKTTNKKFGVFSIKDPDKDNEETLYKNEMDFIKELTSFLEQ